MKTNLPIGRPWLFVAICVFTKIILGYYLSFQRPSYLSVMQCLLHSIRPKTYVKELYPEIVHSWDASGLPEVIVVDNAKQYYSASFDEACLQLGIITQYAPVKTPYYKPSIERMFGSLNTMLLHQLPGTTFSNVSEKWDYDPKKHALISMSSLNRVIHNWIVDVYHHSHHRGIDDVPARRWEIGTKKPLVLKSTKGVVLIESESVWHFQEKLKNSLTLSQTQKRLGTIGKFLSEIVDSGLLHPLRGPTINGSKKWTFTDDDLNRFSERVKALICSSPPWSQNESIRFGLALDIFRRAGGNCGTLFQAVFDRKITISIVGGQQKILLPNLRFCVGEVRTFVRDEATKIHGELYSVAEASSLIGTNPPALRFFIKRGLIQASRLGDLNGPWIRKRDLDQFRKNYFVLTRERARTLGTNTSHIAKLLERQGVQSVSSRGLDNGLQTVFKAADIAPIDLQSTISKSRPRGFPRPLFTQTMKLSRVTEVLGVDRSTALQMIDNGFLTLSTPRRHKHKQRRFHVHARLVEYCKRRNVSYLSLISSSIATNILRVGPHQLRLLVKWGTLKAIYAKPPRYAYFIRDDVEALAKCDEFQLALVLKPNKIRLNRKVLQQRS